MNTKKPGFNARKSLSLEEIQAAADNSIKKDKAIDWKAIAVKAAAKDNERTVKDVLLFHQINGKYPWEMPESDDELAQKQWLQSGGINVEQMVENRIEEIKRLIAEYKNRNDKD